MENNPAEKINLGWFNPHCSYCGRFCKVADTSAPFTTGYVEPDVDYWCESCAKKAEELAVQKGHVPQYWIKPNWSRRAAKRLGWVEIVCGNDSWTTWLKGTDPVQPGWRIVNEENKEVY